MICQKCKQTFIPDKPNSRVCSQCSSWGFRDTLRRPFKIVRCPVDENGLPEYPQGASFSEVEVAKSLRFRGFPSGTVFTYKGAMVKVDKTRLVRMNGQPFDWVQPHG
mgnify:CR=1 FL=1